MAEIKKKTFSHSKGNFGYYSIIGRSFKLSTQNYPAIICQAVVKSYSAYTFATCVLPAYSRNHEACHLVVVSAGSGHITR